MCCRSLFFALSLLASLCLEAAAAEPKIETVVGGLNTPTAVAIQPEGGAVFVAESGAGQVVRIAGGKAEPVLTGWKLGSLHNLSPDVTVGPLCLAFFDKNTLLVGDAGAGSGADAIRVFALPEPGKTAAAETAKEKLGPLSAADSAPPDGIFYGLAATKFAVFATCQAQSSKGWLARSEVNGTKFAELKRFVATTANEESSVPAGLTISPRGEVVVGQFAVGKPSRCRLVFFNANNGKLLLSQETNLTGVTGLAYGPKTGLLYALNFAGSGGTAGGLYRLDAASKGETQTLKATKIVDLSRPTALAFGPDGALYITVLGPNSAAAGQLLKIAPGL